MTAQAWALILDLCLVKRQSAACVITLFWEDGGVHPPLSQEERMLWK